MGNIPAQVTNRRIATGRVGFPKTVGKAFEWLSVQPNPLHVTLTPKGENTRLRVMERFGAWASLFYLLPATLAIMLTVILCSTFGKSPLMSPALFACLLIGIPALTLAGSRIAFGRFCVRKRRLTRNLIARLERAIMRPSEEVVEEVATPKIVEAAPVRPMTSLPASQEQHVTLQSNHNLG